MDSEAVGYFGLHETGTDQFNGVRILVTVGDYHEPLADVHLRAHLLGVCSHQLWEERAARKLLQAGARGRWARKPGKYVDVHFGMMCRPGWEAGTVTERTQPNQQRDAKELRDDLTEAAVLIADRGGVVTVALAEYLLDIIARSMSRPTIRDVLEQQARRPGYEMTKVKSGSRGPRPSGLVRSARSAFLPQMTEAEEERVRVSCSKLPGTIQLADVAEVLVEELGERTHRVTDAVTTE